MTGLDVSFHGRRTSLSSSFDVAFLSCFL